MFFFLVNTILFNIRVKLYFITYQLYLYVATNKMFENLVYFVVAET